MSQEIAAEHTRHQGLIHSSAYSEKLLYLVGNSSLAQSELADGIFPNVFGAITYVIGQNEKIKSLWTEKGKPLDEYTDALGDFVCIPNDDLPGYVGEEPMNVLLQGLSQTALAPDRIIAFYWENNRTEANGFRLRHSGLYLGKQSGEDIFFHQDGIGGRYAISSIDDYKSDLLPSSTETLELKVFAP